MTSSAAIQTLDISPVGRVEGDLDVRVNIENGVVARAIFNAHGDVERARIVGEAVDQIGREILSLGEANDGAPSVPPALDTLH